MKTLARFPRIGKGLLMLLPPWWLCWWLLLQLLALHLACICSPCCQQLLHLLPPMYQRLKAAT